MAMPSGWRRCRVRLASAWQLHLPRSTRRIEGAKGSLLEVKGSQVEATGPATGRDVRRPRNCGAVEKGVLRSRRQRILERSFDGLIPGFHRAHFL